jgi:hypothetical protein
MPEGQGPGAEIIKSRPRLEPSEEGSAYCEPFDSGTRLPFGPSPAMVPPLVPQRRQDVLDEEPPPRRSRREDDDQDAPHIALTTAGHKKIRLPHHRRYPVEDLDGRTLPGGFLWVLGSPQRPSIRASRDNSQSHFTACARRRSGEAWKGAHPSDTRFPKGTPGTVTAAPTRSTRPKTHGSSQGITVLHGLSGKKRLSFPSQLMTPLLPRPAL